MFSRVAAKTRWICAVLVLASSACSGGCGRDPARQGDPQAQVPTESARKNTTLADPEPAASLPDAGVRPSPPADAGPPAPLGPIDAGPPTSRWDGPRFTVLSSSAGIYLNPAAERSEKLGYARSGGRVPVTPHKVEGVGCPAGWYEVEGGGYICSAEGTIDPSDPRARLALHEPNLRGVLPYPYARNVFNGTPLYSSVPSRDQMLAYEPYLSSSADSVEAAPTSVVDAGPPPWWQRKEVSLHEVSLSDLGAESDGVIAKRMVKGFYVAVAGEFQWSSRGWYKTTKGMVAPKDRFAKVRALEFQGVKLGPDLALPVAWAYGYRASRPTYDIDSEQERRAAGSVERHTPIPLTGETLELDGRRYLKAKAGFWVRDAHVRVAKAPLAPEGVASDERWIHVDLGSQTLVALVGTTPVYATLVSSGKESDDLAKDHRTPTGAWNIREKHVTTTMDGDGTAAGDLPYSIEDVPYAMYFEGSYALHAAFWHRNFGVRMSHGCINLAPLDAKYLFFFAGPHVRKGWHGSWSGNGQTGSRLVIEGPPPRRGSRAGR